MKSIAKKLYKHRSSIILALILIYTAYLHGFNMLGFPYYESDEGTYTSQAWSVLTEGKLAPYTYWYDHPPMGWLTIAAWYSILPEAYFTFGNSIDTARVLMLLIFVLNTALVFQITRQITKSVWFSSIAGLIYAASPLIIYFSRRVLLDNVQVMWLLLAVFVLLSANQLTLRRYILSGIFFGLAFLTKITAVMFGFPFLFLLLTLKDRTHKLFRTFAWLCASGAVVSTYFIFALIKQELAPPIFSDNIDRVSFWGTLQFQMSRTGESIAFYSPGSEFYNAVGVWLQRDPVLVIGALVTISLGVLTFFFIKDTWFRFFVLANVFFLMFLIRGGLVIDFYFIPMTPFVCILFALLVWNFNRKISKVLKLSLSMHRSKVLIIIPVTILLGIMGYYHIFADQRYLSVNETNNQNSATKWIKETLPENADIIIDSFMYVELKDPKYINNKIFSNAEWFYKVSRDPEIRDTKFNNDWQRFDYIAVTHEMLKQIDNFPETDLVTQSFEHALPLKKWFENSTSYIDEQKKVSTNGDWAMIYDVNSQTGVELENSWEFYKKNFIFSYGQVIDPTGNVTTSEGQSYAMLRAVWMNDHDTFKGVWAWTQHHLQHRLDDSLLSWKWVGDELIDPANATDADVDIALALLFAYRTFGIEQYLIDAKEIINDLWEYSVVEAGGRYYLLSSNKLHGQVPEGYLFNPSYMSPAHFRIFAEVDTAPGHDWIALANDTYPTINALKRQYATPLIKNWYVLQPNGTFTDASTYIKESANDFSYDAFRIFWRVWLDYAWFNNKDSENYLRLVGSYLEKNILNNTAPTIIDPVSGEILSYRTALAISSSYIFPLTFVDEGSRALEYYNETIKSAYKEDSYWGYSEVYYDQNWVWFNAALYNNDVYNIWAFY